MELQLHKDFLLHKTHVDWITFSGGGGVCSSCRRSAKVSPKKSSKSPEKLLKELNKAEKALEKAEEKVEETIEEVKEVVGSKEIKDRQGGFGLLPFIPESRELRPMIPKLETLVENYDDLDTAYGLMNALTAKVPAYRYSSNTLANAKQTLEEYSQTKYGKAYDKLTGKEKGYLIALYRLNHFGVQM